jgi:hypothetical protein
MKIKGILAMVLGWAVPGLGLAMGGRVYPFQTDNPLTILAFFADIGNGLFYVLGRVFHWGGGDLARATFEFGTAYIAGAGLLNFLVAIDAYDIGAGKKS